MKKSSYWPLATSFSLTTFSPSGKLVQIEYALNAVNAGQPTVGIKAKDGVVIATEKKHKSALQDEATYFKVEFVSFYESRKIVQYDTRVII